MDFFDKMNRPDGGYIFLSHSHEDIAKVRKIRNSLEEDGFEPLCFYLKCLDDESEIEDLIKREIDAREWFVFVNSENSRKSKWVTLEREYIERTNKKKIITVDIDDADSIADAIYKISHNLRIFISYSSHNVALARRIKDKLEEKDYLVFFAPDNLPVGASYAQTVANAIVEASRDGCVLLLLTPDSVRSPHVLMEVDAALSHDGNIVPVLVGDTKLSPDMRFLLCDLNMFHIPDEPEDDELYRLVDLIGERIMNE